MKEAAPWRLPALKWLWLSLLVLILDRVSKELAVHWLSLYEPVAVWPGLNFTLSYNPGAAWGFLANAGGWQRWFLSLLSASVCLFLLLWLWRQPTRPLLCCALALVLGGAAGNLWDRCWSGFVIDFIDCYWRNWRWPTFNIADSAITIGAILLILDAVSDFKSQPEATA